MTIKLRERYGNAKQVAGATATNKAGLANKAAKQSAAMANNSKVMQAILGAQAANDATSQGYDEGLQTGANMDAQVAAEQEREAARKQQHEEFLQAQKQTAEEAERNRKHQSDEAKKNRIWGVASQIAGSLMSRWF